MLNINSFAETHRQNESDLPEMVAQIAESISCVAFVGLFVFVQRGAAVQSGRTELSEFQIGRRLHNTYVQIKVDEESAVQMDIQHGEF